MRANSMAVRADDVALCNLALEGVARFQQDAARTGAEIEELCLGVAMVEVHRIRRKAPSAVGAGSTAQVAQPCERCLLTPRDARDLLLAMARVVRHVVGTLVPNSRHTAS